MYKRLSSKIVLNHPRMTVVEDQVELPSGYVGDYIWIDGWRGAVTVILRDNAGKILVQSEYSYLPDAALLQFPGGRIESGEEPEDAANRELAEEAGLHANQMIRLGSYLIDHRRSRAPMHVFIGENPEPRTTNSKDIYETGFEELWLTEAEIDSLIAEGRVVNAVMLSCWAIYKAKLRQAAE